MSAPGPGEGVRHVSLRSGVYADSVRLMQVSRDVGAREGVAAVLVAMATPLNVDLAAGMGFAPDETPSLVPMSRLTCINRTESAYTPLRSETWRTPDGGGAVTRRTVPPEISQR